MACYAIDILYTSATDVALFCPAESQRSEIVHIIGVN